MPSKLKVRIVETEARERGNIFSCLNYEKIIFKHMGGLIFTNTSRVYPKISKSKSRAQK